MTRQIALHLHRAEEASRVMHLLARGNEDVLPEIRPIPRRLAECDRRRAEAAERNYSERVAAKFPLENQTADLELLTWKADRTPDLDTWISPGRFRECACIRERSRIPGPADTQETDTGCAAQDTQSARSIRSESATEQTEAAATYAPEAPCLSRESSRPGPDLHPLPATATSPPTVAPSPSFRSPPNAARSPEICAPDRPRLSPEQHRNVPFTSPWIRTEQNTQAISPAVSPSATVMSLPTLARSSSDLGKRRKRRQEEVQRRGAICA